MNNDDRFTSSLGHIAQQSSLLEAAVAVVLWGLVGINQQVARIVLPNDTRRMADLIVKLLAVRPTDDELQVDVAAWTTEVRAAHLRRSRVLHALWADDGDPAGLLRVDIRPMKDAPFERYTLSDLERFAQELQQLTFTGADLAERLAAAHPGPWWALGSDATGGRGAIRFTRED